MNFISPSHMTPSYILSIGDIKERLKGIMKRENNNPCPISCSKLLLAGYHVHKKLMFKHFCDSSH